MRSYSDVQLAEAVSSSRSWRGVLRALGLTGTSAGSLRAARHRADALGLRYEHFSGQRRYSDQQLEAAVDGATTWSDVIESLGFPAGSSTVRVRGRAARLGLAVEHLAPKPPPPPVAMGRPDSANLPRAGALIAAAWFELSGHAVAWPLEPVAYDLLVGREAPQRIQVKTTRNAERGSWNVAISASNGNPYDPDELDSFFVVGGDLSCYLIPIQAVAGLKTIRLAAYATYRVPALALLPQGTSELVSTATN